MAAQNQGLGVDQFDAYFRRADLDHDGRISGAEAVSFFQGSGLSKQVLAQIWMHADQSRTGFLSRQEFYNALKLITVAQSKRDLTPDIVKAALYGTASSKIPPPQINVPPAPAGQLASLASTAQMAPTAPTVPQTLGPRGPVPPSNSVSQLHYPAQGNPLMRPPSVTQVTPVSTASRPPQSTPVLPNAGISTDWLSGRAGGFTAGPTLQVSNRGASPLVSAPLPKTQDLQPAPSHSIAKDSKASVSGNGFASNSSFGGDLFSALVPKQNSSSTTSSAVVSSALVPSSPLHQSSSMQSSLQPLQNAFTKQPTGSQLMQSQTLTNKPQQPQTSFNLSQAVSHASSGVVSPANSSGLGSSAPSQSQAPWPKMTAAGIQKYTKLFMDVDTDRDGKITGEQARNLFLSWKLPREVLKQVWDLAEQDNDSMLSLREFCIALYLMERHREGRTLPASLPNSIMFDETLMRMAGLPNSNYNNTSAGVAPGFRQVQGAPGSQQMPSAGAVRPPVPVATHHAEGMRQFNQDRSSLLQRDNFQANQLSHIDQHAVQSDSQEALDAEKKVEKVEKIILDSREKLEYYRTKMQDLVLYKSRCDNRLNEIIERASSDKREAEMVGKKYEEKYKQVAELASKLMIEEATFREYQERKMELHQAIINMEQGGSANGILQVRADRTQSELEELMKALAERCKKHGIEIKSVAMIELPQGWQPGIPEEAAVWNEEWDKFEDEGLLFDKDPKADAQNGTTVSKSASFLDNMYPLDDGYSPDSMSNTDVKSEKHSSRSEHVLDSESGYAHSEDGSARSPQDSPHPASEFSDVFAKTSEADSDFHRGFDDQGWGTFDGNDDVDSVWGFNANSKDSGHDRDRVFESGSFGLSPLRTGSGSPQARGNFNNKSSVFADSVPGTPFSKSANSPRYSEAGDGFFNNYSGFDSFSNQDTHFSPPRETFTRFDSISSSRDESTFGRFDSMNSSRGEAFGRFDSMSSSRGFEHSRGFNSFDDADPFGSSGPFQVSSESKTPKKSSDSWSSF